MKKQNQANYVYKLFSILTVGIFFSASVNGADLAVTFNVSKYQNGNNISCFGAHDGMVEAVIVGGTSPYTYSWNTGSFNRVLTGIGSGSYTFTVTDANAQTVSSTIEMIEPAILELTLLPEFYGGYNISEQGGHDGKIISELKGGSQPYSYSWSTTSTEPNIIGLTAGAYNLSVTDANGCTISGSKTLTEPTPLHIVSITSPQHHGYNVSCNEGHDGQIDLNVTGGVPPYKYDWNTGSFEEDITNLSAGEYSVRVTDDNGAEILTSILLIEPTGVFKITMTPQLYANGFNLSCHDCANGSITAIGVNGVSPFIYLWSNSQTTATISGLQAIDYSCMLTDANGCSAKAQLALHAPDRDDWSMNGNANVDSATQFMGTTDSKSIVFKTNNVERMRIGSQGNVGMLGSLTVPRLILNDELSFRGIHSINYQPSTASSRAIMSFGGVSTTSIASCILPGLNTIPNYQFHGTIQVWENSSVGANLNVLEIGHDGANSIIDATGTSSDPLFNRLLINYYCGRDVFVGNNLSGDLTANHNMFVLGNVGIGTGSPSQKLEIAHTNSDGGVAINQIDPTYSNKKSEIKFNLHGVEQWAIGSHLDNTGPNSFFIWNQLLVPGQTYSMGTAFFIDGSTNNVGIGTEHPNSFKLAVEGKIAARELKVTIENPFPDFVFESAYKLMSIQELDRYIQFNKRLPEMPSAKDVENNNGIEVGQMLTKLVKQNEEQTLYIISLQKQIDEMKTQFNFTKTRN